MISKKKRLIVDLLLVFGASIIAIVSKMALPSEVNIEDFDSLFVKAIGFPIVASLYFVMIYAHNAITTIVFGNKAGLSKIQISLRFGVVFASIYMFGMQEVVVKSSPFPSWGINFIVYQFFGGIGEAIAAFLLCLGISKFSLNERKSTEAKPIFVWRNKVSAVVLIAVSFTLMRTLCYETGIIHSDVQTAPVPVYLWTIVFGLVIGVGYLVLQPIFSDDKSPVKRSVKNIVLTVGLCWTVFNLFIGLIFAGAMAELLIRSGLDVLAVFVAALLWEKHFNKYSSLA
jgi:hypothetical protein